MSLGSSLSSSLGMTIVGTEALGWGDNRGEMKSSIRDDRCGMRERKNRSSARAKALGRDDSGEGVRVLGRR